MKLPRGIWNAETWEIQLFCIKLMKFLPILKIHDHTLMILYIWAKLQKQIQQNEIVPLQKKRTPLPCFLNKLTTLARFFFRSGLILFNLPESNFTDRLNTHTNCVITRLTNTNELLMSYLPLARIYLKAFIFSADDNFCIRCIRCKLKILSLDSNNWIHISTTTVLSLFISYLSLPKFCVLAITVAFRDHLILVFIWKQCIRHKNYLLMTHQKCISLLSIMH